MTSIPINEKREFVKNILKLRQEFNTTRQLIWFDVPQLHSPQWLSAKLHPEMIDSLVDALQFMRANVETEETPFKGFKDYEISKVQRLIDWIRSPVEFDKELAMLKQAIYEMKVEVCSKDKNIYSFC